MFYSTDVRHERFWRVGIARNAVFFPYFRGFEGSQKQVPKTGVAKDRLPKMSKKFAPRLRESDLEVEIVKNWQVRSTFGS